MTTDVKRGFKRKTIEKIITNKIKHWCYHIDNEELRQKVLNDYIVTGGAIASMLMGDLPNDYDVYFNTPEVAKELAEYYLAKIPKDENDLVPKRFVEIHPESGRVEVCLKSAGVATGNNSLEGYRYFEGEPTQDLDQYFEKFDKPKKGRYQTVVISSNAITLTDEIQIVLRFTGDPAEIHKNYDFVHCTNYYSPVTGLVLHQDALESILSKDLKYVGSMYPICSMFRIKKFIKRGWNITAGEMLKISWDIAHLDLENIQTLQDQLTGVDAAYFHEVIRILRDNGVTRDGKPLDRTYLIEVISRVFDGSDHDVDHVLSKLSELEQKQE